jgi:hypothetical protein
VRRLLFLLTILGGFEVQAADDIAAKSVEAMGGAAKFASVQSIRVKGRMRFGQGSFSPFSFAARRPTMYRIELAVGLDHITQAYDGSMGWQSVTGEHRHDAIALAGDSLESLIDQAANAIGGPLVDREKRHNRVEPAGRESVNGVNCYLLKVTFPTGSTRILFIDPTSFLEIQEEFPAKVNGQASTIQQSVSDYRKFGPILVPCVIVTRVKGGPDSQRMEKDTVEINPSLDDSSFTLVKPPMKK